VSCASTQSTLASSYTVVVVVVVVVVAVVVVVVAVVVVVLDVVVVLVVVLVVVVVAVVVVVVRVVVVVVVVDVVSQRPCFVPPAPDRNSFGAQAGCFRHWYPLERPSHSPSRYSSSAQVRLLHGVQTRPFDVLLQAPPWNSSTGHRALAQAAHVPGLVLLEPLRY